MDALERIKANELIKEMRESRESSENQGNGLKLTWMYKGPSDLVDKEEYLLGKAIDKSFNVEQASSNNADSVGRSWAISNVPKRLLSKPESNEQVDVEKKIHEDPLYAIKQKELEARRQLLDNPVKLKELQKMILERNLLKQKKLKKQEKKKNLKKDAMSHMKSIDKVILKKLKILSDGQRKRLLEEAAEVSDSSGPNKRKTKKKGLGKKWSSESVSEEDSSDSSTNYIKIKKTEEVTDSYNKQSLSSAKNKKESNQRSSKGDISCKTISKLMLKKERRKISSARIQKNNCKASRDKVSSSHSNSSFSSSFSDLSHKSGSSSDSGNPEKKKKKIRNKYETHSWRSSCRDVRIEKCISSKRGKKVNNKKMKKHCSETASSSSSSSSSELGVSENERSKRNTIQKCSKKFNHLARLTNVIQSQTSRHDRNYKEKHHASSLCSYQVSEKERESVLEEMMENAKLRKMEREQNLANHRRIQTEEEKYKNYDDGFIRRQISQATSRGTIADRIRSNVNNIQRSKADMDRSFVRK